MKIWKLQNDHESKRGEVPEEIYFPKNSKKLNRPQVCAAFLSYLHIHFNSSTLTSFVTVLNVADNRKSVFFQDSFSSGLEESSICFAAEEKFGAKFGMTYSKATFVSPLSYSPPFKILNIYFFFFEDWIVFWREEEGQIWAWIRLNCIWEVWSCLMALFSYTTCSFSLHKH